MRPYPIQDPDHLGMYDGPEAGVQVAEFNIRRQSPGKIWFEHESGEGAEFDEALFAEVVRQFYKDHF